MTNIDHKHGVASLSVKGQRTTQDAPTLRSRKCLAVPTDIEFYVSGQYHRGLYAKFTLMHTLTVT